MTSSRCVQSLSSVSGEMHNENTDGRLSITHFSNHMTNLLIDAKQDLLSVLFPSGNIYFSYA